MKTISRLLFPTCFLIGTLTYASVPVVELPFKMHGNYILVQVKINQSAPLDFIFDISAMETIITAQVAGQLGLEPTGQRRVLTASEIRTLDEVGGQSLLIGDLPFERVTILVDNHYLEEFDKGEKIKGIIGYPVFSNYVVEIDYDAEIIRLYDHEKYDNRPGKWIEYTSMYNVPMITGQLGINDTTVLYGEFLLDTGSDYAIILTNNFLRKNSLMKKLGPHYKITAKKYPKTEYVHTRIAGINFANYFFADISAVYFLGKGGLLGFKTFDGIIGNEILKRFNLVYDHIGSKIYLKPNSNFDNEFGFDCSGLVLKYNADDSRVFVTQVIKNSPADAASIRVGDVLKAVNFDPVFNYDLVEIRQILSRPGEKLDLEIERGGKIMQKRIGLESLIP